ncbi:MAG TPA: hypothetical protein VLH19_05260 [Patescibacteria group bacterium]|nr:hypothetical protein [Patescibacteria group bacterium]
MDPKNFEETVRKFEARGLGDQIRAYNETRGKTKSVTEDDVIGEMVRVQLPDIMKACGNDYSTAVRVLERISGLSPQKLAALLLQQPPRK